MILPDYYQEFTDELSNNHCSLISIGVLDDIRAWQKEISDQILSWTIKTRAINIV